LKPFHDSVNTVNALTIARGRGIRVVESKSTEAEDFANLIGVSVRTDRGETRAAGTLYGRQEPRLVEIDGLRMEAVLEGILLIYANLDVPGVIGRIGTLLGRHNVNIAGMQLGRKQRGGRAISAVNVDDLIPPPVLEEIRRLPNIVFAKVVRL
jgi:D-3-phosphoglycerate dehydrogenase